MGACYVINVRGIYPEALSFKGASPVIDDRIEKLMTLRLGEACFVIDFRCVSLKATNFMLVYCLIHLFDYAIHPADISKKGAANVNVSLKT